MSETPNEAPRSLSELTASALGRRTVLKGAAGSAALLAAAPLIAACGSSSSTSAKTTIAGATTTAGGGATTTAAKASGALTFGSNYSDAKPKAAMAAAVGALPNKDIKPSINTVDHNSFQQNITTYLQAPDDVFAWFAGYRMRFFAAKGQTGDISSVWANLGELSSGFKTASTGDDGKQYFVPFYYYPWAVMYRKSLFADKGYKIPVTIEETMTLAEKMKADGLVPFAFANDGKWPAMGTFDQLNLRINGYQFHIDLMAGKGTWTDAKVKAVFKAFNDLLAFHQTGANGRTWQEAAQAMRDKKAGMYTLGTFAAGQFTVQADLDDLDFFAFPQYNTDHGQDAVEAPIDGFMMAKSPKNAAAAKELLAFLGTAPAQDAYLKVDPSAVAASSKADTSAYTALQKKSADFVGKAKFIAQFLDRDTNPEFASNVVGPAIADFISDPTKIDSILSGVEDKKKTIFTS